MALSSIASTKRTFPAGTVYDEGNELLDSDRTTLKGWTSAFVREREAARVVMMMAIVFSMAWVGLSRLVE